MGYIRPISNREVFSFFRFSVSERYGIAFTVEWNTTERERERNKKINYLFFTLFCFEEGKHLFDEGNEFFSSC